MKTKVTYTLIAFCTLLSCEKAIHHDTEYEQPVSITILTRADTPGSPQDSEINTIRVLGYRAVNKTLAFNKTLVTDPQASDPENGNIQGTIDVLTGTFDFIFIANETSDPALTALLDDANQIGTLPGLKEITVSETAFSNQKNIPMVTFIENVRILSDNTYQLPGSDTSGDTWNVELERIGIRIDLELTMTDDFAPGATLSFENLPDRVYLLQKDNTANTVTRNMSAPTTETPGTGTLTRKWERIILPESWFADKTNETKAVTVAMTNGETSKKASLGLSPPDDFTQPRNYYFDITGTVRPTEIEVNIEIVDWADQPIRPEL